MDNEQRRNELEGMIGDIDKDGEGLTDYELGFIESMFTKLDDYDWYPSIRQYQIVEKMYEERL